MATSDYEVPTEEEVWDHIHSIPTRLELCAQGKHNFDPTEWTGYTEKGQAVDDPNKAAWFDITETCIRNAAGQHGCGEKRSYQSEHNKRTGSLDRFTDYTYSNQNPLLVGPRGISFTGINKRTVMPGLIAKRKIFKPRVQLAPTGATKRALARSA